MGLVLGSWDFHEGERISTAHTADDANTSPPLWWDDLPDGTQQLALIMDDADTPGDGPFVHWVVFAISPVLDGLPAGVARKAQIDDLRGLAQGVNSFNQLGYDGPAPPVGSGGHRYRFELFALDRPVQLEPKVDHEALRAAMAGTILERAVLACTYTRIAERV